MNTTYAVEQSVPTAFEMLEHFVTLRGTFVATRIEATIGAAIRLQSPWLYWFLRNMPVWISRPTAKLCRLHIQRFENTMELSTYYRVFLFGRRISTFTICLADTL